MTGWPRYGQDYKYTYTLNEMLLYNIKDNWSLICSKSIRLAITIHIASLSFKARGKKQTISVIAITSKSDPGHGF